MKRWIFGCFVLVLGAGAALAQTNTAPTVANPIPDQDAAEDTAFSFQFADNTFSDPDAGDTLTYSASQPGGEALPAWLSFDAGARTFFGTPGNDDVGALTVRVTATDSAMASAEDDFVITVSNANDPPQAVDDSFDVEGNSSGNTFDVLANDSDPDMGDGRQISAVGSPSSGGSVTIIEGGSRLSYTPAAGFSGTETFGYTVQDSAGATGSATVTVNVSAPPPPPNQAPTAANDQYTGDEDVPLEVPAPGVLANDSDPDGDGLSAVLGAGPSHGTLTLAPNGGFRYTPGSQFSGEDSFTYRAHDGAAMSATATVLITVTGAGDAPVAGNDSYSTAEDRTLTVAAPGVLDNDRDSDGDDLSAVLASGPGSGTLDLNSDGGFSYEPQTDFNGTDSFTYRASDGALQSGVATVTITVGVDNDEPVAAADSYEAVQRRTLTVPAPGVLDNDRDAENDALQALLVSPPTFGTVGLQANGGFSYTPHGDFAGEDGFEYQATDGKARSNVVSVAITVTPSDEPPPPPPIDSGGGAPGTLLLALLALAAVARRR